MAGIDAGRDTHYDPNEGAQERLAKYQDRIALLGAFAEPEPREERVLQDGVPGPGEFQAAHIALNLVRRRIVDYETTVGIRSMVPTAQVRKEDAAQHSINLIKVALGFRYDTNVISGEPLRVEQVGFQTPAQAAHAALDTMLCDLEMGLDDMQVVPSARRVRVLVVTDPVYIAQTFGDFDPAELRNGAVCGLNMIGGTADENRWVPLPPLPLQER